MMHYLQLFYEFFKVGLFAVGGGMATFPFMSRLADKTGWFTQNQLTDMVAIAESTPGPIGVNMATYVGYTTGGPLGAVITTLGLITPSVIIILIVARMLTRFRESKLVQNVFYGLRPASTGLIAAAGFPIVVGSLTNLDLGKVTGFAGLFDWKCVILCAVLLVLMRWTPKVKDLHPVVFIALSAIVGIVFRFAGV